MEQTISKANLLSTYRQNTKPAAFSPSEAQKQNSPIVTKTQAPPKINQGFFFFAMLAPVIVLLAPAFLMKFIAKSDKSWGINQESVKKVLDYMFKENKLSEKGVSIQFHEDASVEAADLMKKFGGAAYSYSKNNSVNKINCAEGRASMALHEAGHAISRNCKKLGKLYTNFVSNTVKIIPDFAHKLLGLKSPVNMAFFGVFALQMIGNNYNNSRLAGKNPDEKKFSLSKFIHKNIGIITAVCFAPILIDEGYASCKAIQAAKKIAPEMVKPLTKNLLLAGSTYLLTAGVSLFSSLANRKISNQAYDVFKYKQEQAKNKFN